MTLKHSTQVGLGMVRSLAMTMGELNYGSMFPNFNTTEYLDVIADGNVNQYSFSIVLFILFVIAMPIVLVNLLVHTTCYHNEHSYRVISLPTLRCHVRIPSPS